MNLSNHRGKQAKGSKRYHDADVKGYARMLVAQRKKLLTRVKGVK